MPTDTKKRIIEKTKVRGEISNISPLTSWNMMESLLKKNKGLVDATLKYNSFRRISPSCLK